MSAQAGRSSACKRRAPWARRPGAGAADRRRRGRHPRQGPRSRHHRPRRCSSRSRKTRLQGPDGQFQPVAFAQALRNHRHDRAGLSRTRCARPICAGRFSPPSATWRTARKSSSSRSTAITARRAYAALRARAAKRGRCDPAIRPKTTSSAITRIIAPIHSARVPQDRRSRRDARDREGPGEDHRGRSQGRL